MSPQTPTKEQISVRGREIALQRHGNGAPLVILHGTPGLSFAGRWPAFADQFTDAYDVIVPDHPGFGDSPRWDDADCIEDLVVHYLDLLQELGLGSVQLVGHSFGGWVAAEIASTAPSVVERLVLANPLGLWIPESPMPDAFIRDAIEVTALGHGDGYSDGVPQTVDEQAQWYGDWAASAQYGWPAMHNRKLKGRLHRVTAPTLILASENVQFMAADYGRLYADSIPGASLVVVPDAEHAGLMDTPEPFATEVRQFLSADRG